jgi:hypothetical protein
MYYREFLRVRRVFIGFAIGLACITILVLLLTGHVSGSLSDAPPAPGHAVVAAAAATDNGHGPAVGMQIQGDSGKAPLEVLFGLAGFIAAIFAMVLGCALSGENNGHLEIAWTRPTSRTSYAVRTAFVDWIGILAMYALVLALSALIISVERWWPNLPADGATTAIAARLFVFPFAWYGLVSALTASMRGGAGLVAGLSWPVASVSIVLEKLLHNHSILAGVLSIINYVNPLLYTSFSDTESSSGSTVLTAVSSEAFAIVALACIAVGGIAAAVLQWRRLEA